MQRALAALADATRGTVYDGALWVVGGAVRDPPLGTPAPAALALVPVGSAIELAETLYAKGV